MNQLFTSLRVWLSALCVFAFANYRATKTLAPEIIGDTIVDGFFVLALAYIRRPYGRILAYATISFVLFSALFETKMNLPLSLSLLRHAGNILDLQTSIISSSNLRPFVLLAAIIAAAGAIDFAMRWVPRRLIVLSGTIAFALSATAFLVSERPPAGKISAFFRDANNHSEYLSYFESLDPKEFRWRYFREVSPDRRKNVVIYIAETFEQGMLETPEAKEKMPFLTSLLARQTSVSAYQNYFTPWAFSAKALYSILCSTPPYPGDVIEMRIKAKTDCGGPFSRLKENSYFQKAYYAGDRAYDNMGKFLLANGFEAFDDRTSMKHRLGSERYREMHWGIDDMALIDSFGRDLVENKLNTPFTTMFIGMSSHHPYWVPSAAPGQDSGDYQASLSYQDQVIRKLYDTLAKHQLLEDTVLVITSDHGRRQHDFNSSKADFKALVRNMYRVPLIVINEGTNRPSAHIQAPSSHLDMGSILNRALQGQDFLPEEPAYLFNTFGEPYFLLTSLEEDYLFKPREGFFGVLGSDKSCECKEAKRKMLARIRRGADQFLER